MEKLSYFLPLIVPIYYLFEVFSLYLLYLDKYEEGDLFVIFIFLAIVYSEGCADQI